MYVCTQERGISDSTLEKILIRLHGKVVIYTVLANKTKYAVVTYKREQSGS